MRVSVGAVVIFFLAAGRAGAGPPFTTDDPIPVGYRQWEFYVASQHTRTADGWTGTAPHIEVNYGPTTNLQLHLIAPLAYAAPAHTHMQYGYGDTELGAKYQFIKETERMPAAGIFPLLEAPSGDSDRGLGSGHVQAFLPVWVQKSFGQWTLIGGGGYGINPGAGNRDWALAGFLLQNQVRDNLLVGGEIYHQTSTEVGERANTAFNLGTVFDINAHHHLLFSAGRSIKGPTRFQSYLAYLFTF